MSRLWMICYDISDDDARGRVEDILLVYGERVQRSVFECYLRSGEFAELRHRLAAEIDPATDSLRYYPLCSWCETRVKWQGEGRAPEDPDLYLV